MRVRGGAGRGADGGGEIRWRGSGTGRPGAAGGRPQPGRPQPGGARPMASGAGRPTPGAGERPGAAGGDHNRADHSRAARETDGTASDGRRPMGWDPATYGARPFDTRYGRRHGRGFRHGSDFNADEIRNSAEYIECERQWDGRFAIPSLRSERMPEQRKRKRTRRSRPSKCPYCGATHDPDRKRAAANIAARRCKPARAALEAPHRKRVFSHATPRLIGQKCA